MPLQATSGAASYDAFGGGVPVVPNYIEQVFSAYVYTGVSGSNVTINNGINLSVNGGLIWSKGRNELNPHSLTDTVRGVGNALNSASTADTVSSGISSFTTTGYVTNTSGATNGSSSETYVSWTFRKQPKFFDVVTYTGNSVAGREIAHNLGSVPGCMIVKSTSDAQDWAVYHRSLGNTKRLVLNGTDAEITSTVWNNTTPTSTVFTVSDNARVNSNGSTYVAYLFAHDAGGFGLTGTDNVVSCGSFDANLGEVISLGYEPQWLLYKDSSSTSNWRIADTMRGLTNLSGTNAQTIQQLVPNSTAVEGANSGPVLTSTGFTWNQSGGGNKHIYIAIRRGPMKVPTSGTSVFTPALGSSSGVYTITTNFPVDSCWYGNRTNNDMWYDFDRLRGNPYLRQNTTAAEVASSGAFDSNVNFRFTGFTGDGSGYINYAFRRAPSFFDEVCYTGTGSATTFTHNLGVVPEMMIVKTRSDNANWAIYTASLGPTKSINFTTAAEGTYSVVWNDTAPTSSVFTVGTAGTTNNSGSTYVAYLFATCAGVSKVGSYTGTATTLQIDCGFTGGARFVLIKRTDSTGAWYVWDTARGIVSGNDPYLLLNSDAAEVTNTDYIDTYSAGFEISSTAPSAINASGGTFIFLAIA